MSDHSTAPHLVVIAGPNGAGKTTSAQSLLRLQVGISAFVNADVIAQGLAGFDPASVALEAGKIMLRRLDDLSAQRQTFAFETTLASRSFARRLRLMQADGYQVSILFLYIRSPELALQRVIDRVARGGHDIPEDVLRRRYASGIRNFFALYAPIADVWMVMDNSMPDGPRSVAEKKVDGTITISDEDLWNRMRAFS